jgi:hypothetical protein
MNRLTDGIMRTIFYSTILRDYALVILAASHLGAG